MLTGFLVWMSVGGVVCLAIALDDPEVLSEVEHSRGRFTVAAIVAVIAILVWPPFLLGHIADKMEW